MISDRFYTVIDNSKTRAYLKLHVIVFIGVEDACIFILATIGLLCSSYQEEQADEVHFSDE